MSVDESEVLDMSKENIQPLRHGRKAAQLKTALQAQIDPEVNQQLLKEREKYEFMIRMYEGEDPLDPYYNYILWLEQSFPCISRENNMFLMLEDTLLKFKDCSKYRQDPRLILLLVKYISFQPNPLELYQLVYNQGLGTMCSLFYKSWAEELEKANDFKRADQVFQLGLRCRAEPRSDLENAHIQFQLAIARKLLEGNLDSVTAATNVEPSRIVLSKLSKVKSNRTSRDSAGILSSISQNTKSSNFGIGKFDVYEEKDDDGDLNTRFKNESEKLPRGSIANRENTISASKWHGQKVKQAPNKKTSVNFGPTFNIHEDPEAACDNIKTIRPYVLKTRKEEFRCPVAIFGPPNPNQQPMYPKQLVYVGGRDVQLEEIRAAFYWKRLEKSEQENSQESQSDRNTNYSPLIFGSQTSEDVIASQLTSIPNSSPEELQENLKTLPSCQTKAVIADDVYSDENAVTKSGRYTKLFEPHGCDMLITPARPFVNVEVYVDEDNLCNTREKSHKIGESADVKEVLGNASVSESLFLKENAQCNRKAIAKTELAVPGDKEFEFVKPAPPSRKKKIADDIDVFVDGIDSSRNKGVDEDLFDLDFMEGCGRNDAIYYQKSESVRRLGTTGDRENTNLNQSLSTSMTINTKAAMNVIQEMWESPLTQQNPFDSMDAPVPIKSNKCLFPVYCEDDDLSTPKNSNGTPFPIFSDDTFFVHRDKRSECAKDSAAKTKSANSKKNAFPVFYDDSFFVQSNKQSECVESSTVKKVSANSKKNAFPVFCDDSFSVQNDEQSKCVESPTVKKVSANSKKNPFPVFCDGMLSVQSDKQPECVESSTVKKVSSNSKENPFPVFCDNAVSVQRDGQSKRIDEDPTFKLPSKSKVSHHGETNLLKAPRKSCHFDRKFGAALPLIVPVKLNDSPVRPDDKENRFPVKYSPDDEYRCGDGASDEEQFQDHKTCEIDDETCNTKVFAVALPSSTPCPLGQRSRTSRKFSNDASYLAQDHDFSICCAKPEPISNASYNPSENCKISSKISSDLSLILENSKEHGSSSLSSSSGNTGSKLLFS